MTVGALAWGGRRVVATVTPEPSAPHPSGPDASGPEASGPPPSGPAVPPVDFPIVTGRLTAADGSEIALQLWLADTPERHGRGLMDVTDLCGADGMVFAFDEPTLARFYMWQTPMPLTVAFFDERGGWVGGAEMAPCLDEGAARCERFASPEPYVAALEVPQGALAGALGPGAMLVIDERAMAATESSAVPTSSVGDRCEAADPTPSSPIPAG